MKQTNLCNSAENKSFWILNSHIKYSINKYIKFIFPKVLQLYDPCFHGVKFGIINFCKQLCIVRTHSIALAFKLHPKVKSQKKIPTFQISLSNTTLNGTSTRTSLTLCFAQAGIPILQEHSHKLYTSSLQLFDLFIQWNLQNILPRKELLFELLFK